MNAGDPDIRFTTAEAAARLGVDARILSRRLANECSWAAWLHTRPADGPVWSPRDLIVMAYLRDSRVSGPGWARDQVVDLLRRVPWGAAAVTVTHHPFAVSYTPPWSLAEPATSRPRPVSNLPCGGPDRCPHAECSGRDYGICGEPSDTEACRTLGVHGDRCTLDHTDDAGFVVDDTGTPPRNPR